MNKLIKIGVSGEQGSFSEEAGWLYAKKARIENPEYVYLIDMENVLAAVEAGKIDIGIFPVVNLHGGLVKMAFEAMGKHTFLFVDKLWLNVEQCLIVKPGIQKEQITQIRSHTQALAQCKTYLTQHFSNIPQIEWEDTAKAAKDLSEGRLESTIAVIGSSRCKEIYHLDVLQKGIQDQKPNLTAFIVTKNRRGL